MSPHVCPWWGGYFIDNWLRRLLHPPERILAPYVTPGTTAMDFGCGMGMFTIALARLVGEHGRVVAVDLQQQMLDVLTKRARRAGVAERITTHRCQADSIGVDGPVDFALAFYSAHEVPDLVGLLGELRACLRAGGKLLVVEPVGHVTRREFDRMVSAAEGVGFKPHEGPAVRLSRAVVFSRE